MVLHVLFQYLKPFEIYSIRKEKKKKKEKKKIGQYFFHIHSLSLFHKWCGFNIKAKNQVRCTHYFELMNIFDINLYINVHQNDYNSHGFLIWLIH